MRKSSFKSPKIKVTKTRAPKYRAVRSTFTKEGNFRSSYLTGLPKMKKYK